MLKMYLDTWASNFSYIFLTLLTPYGQIKNQMNKKYAFKKNIKHVSRKLRWLYNKLLTFNK